MPQHATITDALLALPVGADAIAEHLIPEAPLRISQSTAARALARFEQMEPADADLSLHEIEQDEATRVPANARKQRRLARARRVRAQRRFDRMNARQLITLRLDTPAPSRRQAILAAREAQSQAAAA